MKKGKTKKTGTKVTFKPDDTIFKASTSFNFDVLRRTTTRVCVLEKFKNNA
ncbi:hypothetical protein ACVNP0_13930 [Staphylococcus aureus]